MTKIALIDGDSFLYRAGFSVEKTKYLVESFSDGLGTELKAPEYSYAPDSKEASARAEALKGVIWTRKEVGSVNDAVAVLDSMIKKALKAIDCETYFLYLSPSTGNFRDSIGTIRKYKGNRDGLSRPVYYTDLREHLGTVHQAIVARGEEADDQISWVARKWREQHRDYTIVGIDKDLKQIPGKHYDWVEDKHVEVNEEEARIYYWAQVLAGDSGDNVVGCWKMGLRKAENFLLSCDDFSDEAMWPKIVRKFKESQKLEGCPYKDLEAAEVALETIRLIRLRRTMNERLWEPPQGKKEEDYPPL